MFEAYFDESGDLEVSPNIFCVAGYYIHSERAKQMAIEWQSVLDHHHIQFFRMVDCAHGNGQFEGKSLDERVNIETKLISLIKKHTSSGFAAVCYGEGFDRQGQRFPNAYGLLGHYCMSQIDMFLTRMGWDDPVAYFFESGHKHKASANIFFQEDFNVSGRSITFASKRDAVLLQAGDLLAWQCSKYSKDQQSGERGPRIDFLSLMQHHHTVVHLSLNDDGRLRNATELWPLSERPRSNVVFNGDYTGPVPILLEQDDPQSIPIIPIDILKGWRSGPVPNSVQIIYKPFGENTDIAIMFDHRRMIETMVALIQASHKMNPNDDAYILSPAAITSRLVEQTYLIDLVLSPGARLAISIPKEAANELANQILDQLGVSRDA